MYQQTIGHSFTLSGKGLHTGLTINATFNPAEPNTGIRIRRVDLPSQPAYEALAQYVTQTTRGTVLENGAWRVSTVEHALSALYAMGITNCLIDLNAPEMPILDGSAQLFVEAITQAGVVQQDAEAKEWVVTEPLTFDNGKGSVMTITPSNQYELHVIVRYPSPILSEQSAQLTDLSTYPQEIAAARTFCFLREVKPLLQLGLIKGGDLQNALVIYDKPIWQCSMNRISKRLHQPLIDASKLGYLSPLKYENEPARHKLLDVIGDLALVGMRIRARIDVTCPGHGFNTSCAKQIINNQSQITNIQ